MDYLESKIRKLARSYYWQNLYSSSKECANIQLFANQTYFSGLQLRFLYWLAVYSMLTEELMKHEDDYLTQAVIDDEYRTDAYLTYRNKKHEHLWKKYRREEKLAEHKSRHPGSHEKGNAQLIDVDLRSS